MSTCAYVACVQVEVDNSDGSWVCGWMSEGVEHENINSSRGSPSCEGHPEQRHPNTKRAQRIQ